MNRSQAGHVAGIRLALGASRARLVGLVLKEALALVTIGGGLGGRAFAGEPSPR